MVMKMVPNPEDDGPGCTQVMVSSQPSAMQVYKQVHIVVMYGAMQVFQIAVTSTYGVTGVKENLLALYNKAGVKGNKVTFLITDNLIINERFLVFINDFLSTGFITDLCSPVGQDLPLYLSRATSTHAAVKGVSGSVPQ